MNTAHAKSLGAAPAAGVGLLLAAALISGCDAMPVHTQGNGRSPGVPLSDVRLTSAQIAALGHDDDLFAGDLVKEMAGSGNMVVSPASIAIALQQLTDGAAGQTQAQLERALHTGALTDRQLTAASAALFADLRSLSSQLSVNDDVWLQQGTDPSPEYAADLTSGFGEALHHVDFDEPVTAAATIDAAISADTHGHITDLVSPDGIADDVAMLTDAVYLHAKWADPFPAAATAPASFATPDGPRTVQMMQQSAGFTYADHVGYQAVTLPYTGGRLSMTVLLPAAGSSPATLEARAAVAGWSGLLEDMTPTPVALSLPEFSLRTTVDLTQVLRSLGITDAFGGAAELPGPCPKVACQVSDVQHEAWIRTDEQGTTAAAATSIGMTTSAVIAHRPDGVVMDVDRPFVAVIRDARTGLPLFVAQVDNPE